MNNDAPARLIQQAEKIEQTSLVKAVAFLERETSRPAVPSDLLLGLGWLYFRAKKMIKAASTAQLAIEAGAGPPAEDLLEAVMLYYVKHQQLSRALEYARFLYDRFHNQAALYLLHQEPSVINQASTPMDEPAAELVRQDKKHQSRRHYRRVQVKTKRLVRRAEELLFNQPEQAIAAAEKLLDASPNNEQAFIIRARGLILLDQTDRAVELAFERVYIQPDAAAYNFLGQTYFYAQQFFKAKNAFENSLDIKRDDYTFHWLVRTLYMRGDYLGAFYICQERLKTFPNSKQAKHTLAEIQRKLGRYRQALHTLKTISPRGHQQDLCQAYCLLQLSQFSNALRSFDSAAKQLAATSMPTINNPMMRLHCGYVFLLSMLERTSPTMEPQVYTEAINRVKQAAAWLREQKPYTISPMQTHDFESAMRILTTHPVFKVLVM